MERRLTAPPGCDANFRDFSWGRHDLWKKLTLRRVAQEFFFFSSLLEIDTFYVLIHLRCANRVGIIAPGEQSLRKKDRIQHCLRASSNSCDLHFFRSFKVNTILLYRTTRNSPFLRVISDNGAFSRSKEITRRWNHGFLSLPSILSDGCSIKTIDFTRPSALPGPQTSHLSWSLSILPQIFQQFLKIFDKQQRWTQLQTIDHRIKVRLFHLRHLFNDFQVIPQMLMAQQQLMAIRTAQARMALVQQEVRFIVDLEDFI